MRFNPKARLDTSRVRDVGGSGGAAARVVAACGSRSRGAPRPAAASAAS